MATTLCYCTRAEVVGLDYELGDVLRYSYELEGAGSGWSPARNQHTVSYAALTGGKYRFLVKAITSEGVESAALGEYLLKKAAG